MDASRKSLPRTPPARMRTAVLTAPGRFRLEEVSVPEPAPHQVRIRLEGCGVCGSNLPPWEGRPWFNYPFPSGAPGHEGWGRIDAVGEAVRHLRPGSRVATLSTHAFAEYDVANADEVVVLPPSLEGQPFPGEPLACAMNVFRRSDIQPGHRVAVVGVGFLGAVLTQLAAGAGAHVVALSRRPWALQLARSLGAEATLALEERGRTVEQVKALTGGVLFDRVLEVAGVQETLDVAGQLTRERGRLVIAGYHQDGPRQVDLQLWNWRGLDVINAHEREPAVYLQGLRMAVAEVAEGRLDPQPLYTHSFSLERLDEAFETMSRRPEGFLKALVRI